MNTSKIDIHSDDLWFLHGLVISIYSKRYGGDFIAVLAPAYADEKVADTMLSIGDTDFWYYDLEKMELAPVAIAPKPLDAMQRLMTKLEKLNGMQADKFAAWVAKLYKVYDCLENIDNYNADSVVEEIRKIFND